MKPHRVRPLAVVLIVTAALGALVVSDGIARAQPDPASLVKGLAGTGGDEGEDARDDGPPPRGEGPATDPARSPDLEQPDEVARTIWTFPLFESGEDANGEPTYVHLNELALAIVSFLVVFFAVRWAARRGLRLLLRKVDARGSTTYIAQKSVSVALIILGVILAMVIGGLPWSFLALGLGLVAVGTTLGAQKLLGNYLSGYVMACERVVEPGDCVEVDGERGYVMAVSGRYTRLRRFDGIDVLLPNSQLLEGSFVNWNVNERRVRGRISLSVVYGSPVDDVVASLEQRCAELDSILDDPKPVVLLAAFEDSGIRFDVYFWTIADKPTQLWLVESDLRVRICGAFASDGVEFAFPQRELHIHDDARALLAQASDAPSAPQSGDRGAADALSGEPRDGEIPARRRDADADAEDDDADDRALDDAPDAEDVDDAQAA